MRPITLPNIINKKRLSSSRLAAAARGPGVGGIKTWGAKSPVDNATVNDTMGVLVWFDIDLFNEFKIINAESQKTGIDTM